MKTTYAVSFTVDDATEVTRIRVIDAVSDWLADHFPIDERPPGTFVRAREGAGDPVFRLSIDESTPRSTHASSFTVTVFLENRKLHFDARNVSIPRSDKVMPTETIELPRTLIVRLVTKVLESVKVYDANEQLTPHAVHARTEMEGGAVGALIHASGRRVPLIVEIVDFTNRKQSVLDNQVAVLAGIAHVRVIDNAEALGGFSNFGGDRHLAPGDIAVYWAGGRSEPVLATRNLVATSIGAERNALLGRVIDTAALALAPVNVPPPPITYDDEFDDDLDHVDDEDEADEGTTNVERDEIEARWADYERQIAELQATVADADRIIGEQRDEIERTRGQRDDAVLLAVHLETSGGGVAPSEGVTTMREALAVARANFTYLTFHERAIESGEALQGPQPMLVLGDLHRLNNVARAWQSRDSNKTTFTLLCRDNGLDFASGVGEQARQKYGEDYTIAWRGRTVLAEAHVKRGKKSQLYRIHVYLDRETQQVVVAYIGRHLRGKRDSN